MATELAALFKAHPNNKKVVNNRWTGFTGMERLTGTERNRFLFLGVGPTPKIEIC